MARRGGGWPASAVGCRTPIVAAGRPAHASVLPGRGDNTAPLLAATRCNQERGRSTRRWWPTRLPDRAVRWRRRLVLFRLLCWGRLARSRGEDSEPAINVADQFVGVPSVGHEPLVGGGGEEPDPFLLLEGGEAGEEGAIPPSAAAVALRSMASSAALTPSSFARASWIRVMTARCSLALRLPLGAAANSSKPGARRARGPHRWPGGPRRWRCPGAAAAGRRAA